MTPPQPFRDQLADFAEGFAPEQQDAVIYTWNQWFDEIFCDACGFFAFGPAYVLSIIHRIQQDDPYHFPEQIGPVSEFHPPDALRFSYLDELARTYLPADLYDLMGPARDKYRQHLDLLEDERPAFYDDWVNDKLLSLITEEARTYDDEFDTLLEQLTDDVSTPDSPSDPLYYRVECNETWIERVQNGGY